MGELEKIIIPTMADVPPELRPPEPARRPRVVPKLPRIDPADVPEPINYQVLVLPATIPEMSAGGIALTPDSVRHGNLFRTIGVVLKIGPLAYSQARGYPADYAPIAVGDWVAIHEDDGVTSVMHGPDGLVAIKYVADNEIRGKVTNPTAMMVLR